MRYGNIWIRALFDGFRDPAARPLYIAAFGLLSIGTVFYALVEKWSLLDSLYFSVTTLATVGLGDFTPHTDLGKIFTIFYILAGVSVILAFANAVLERAATRRRDQQQASPVEPVQPDPEA